jgi:superfamily II DNA or RNA helicase
VTRLTFSSKDPNKGYTNNNILIPKSAEINPRSLKQLLTFQYGIERKIEEGTGQAIGTQSRVIELWDETDTHFIVPREFLANQELPGGVEEWVQESFKTRQFDLPDTIVLQDHQVEALQAMQTRRGGTVNLACGKGKTVLALHYAVKTKAPALVVVNQGALMSQWVDEVAAHIDPNLPVGIIQAEQFEWEGYPIVVAMLHTLAGKRDQLSMAFRKYFRTVFFDEGHHMSAPFFVQAADTFFGDRFSLTATATRGDGLENIYQYHLGPIIYQNLEQDLIPYTTIHRLGWQPNQAQLDACRDRGGTMNHGLYCVMLSDVEWRNEYILEQVEKDVRSGRDVLVLAHAKDHGRNLFYDWPYKGAVLLNAEDVPDFDERIRLLNTGNPVFATFNIAKEALNKKSLAAIHYCSTFASSNDIQQSLGRIQRDESDKLEPLAHVYADTKIKMSQRQGNDIRTYLKAVGYPYEDLAVEIET